VPSKVGIGGMMNIYIKCFLVIPFVVVMFQFYMWIISLEGAEKQKHCKALGTTYTFLGIVSFVFKSFPIGIVGVILIILGLRLIAHGFNLNDEN
jgi:dolichol kinase